MLISHFHVFCELFPYLQRLITLLFLFGKYFSLWLFVYIAIAIEKFLFFIYYDLAIVFSPCLHYLKMLYTD